MPVNVTDPMPGLSTVTCPQPILGPGAFETCTATYTTTQADVDAGQITNTGTASGTPPTGAAVTAQSSATVQAVQTAGISLVKSSDTPSYAAAGTTITYHYAVTNTGNVTLNPITVTDPMSGLSAINCDGVTSLAPAAFVTCDATYVTTQADVDAGQVTNTGSVSGTPPTGTPVTDTSTVTVTANQAPAIGIVKSANPSSFSTPGVVITYSFVVSNVGNDTLDPVTVADPLPGLSTISCPDLSLAPTDSETCTASYTTSQADVDAGHITNTATATGTPPIGDPVTNTSTLITPANQSPAISISKSASVTTFATPGIQVNYSYLVANTGNVTLDPVTVTDPMPGLSTISCPFTMLAPAASGTCSATYTTTQADVDRSAINNTGTATGTPPSGPVVSAISTVSVPAAQLAGITLLKSADVSDFASAGQTINYSYLVTNSGNVTLNPVVVSDPMPGLIGVLLPNHPAGAQSVRDLHGDLHHHPGRRR